MKQAFSSLCGAAAITCALLVLGCNPPDAVTKFSASAQTTLSSGLPVFEDFKQSCRRELEARQAVGSFEVPPSFAECDAIGARAIGLEAASRVLSDYFDALNKLASFNTGELNNNVGGLVTQVNSFAKLQTEQQKAVTSIADFIVNLASSSYQRKHLADDIVKANPDVKIVLSALQASISEPGLYLDLLSREQQAITVRNKEFLAEHPASAQVILSLDERWRAETATLNAKRTSATTYVTALETLAKAHEDLAENANNIKATELAAVLTPYSDQLSSLIPVIKKAF